MTCEKIRTTPPNEWYEGIAIQGEGLRRVFIGTAAFYGLDHKLRLHMGNWGHTQLTFGRTEYERQETAQFHEQEGTMVKELTGFDPNILMEHARKLEKEFKGSPMGPFPFEVEWFT